MRLARLVAAGLAIGVVTGFAIALLRPRRSDPIARPYTPPVSGSMSGDGHDDVLDIRTQGPVTG